MRQWHFVGCTSYRCAVVLYRDALHRSGFCVLRHSYTTTADRTLCRCANPFTRPFSELLRRWYNQVVRVYGRTCMRSDPACAG